MSALVSARALWWREAEECHCVEEFADQCTHTQTTGWVSPLWIGEINGWTYLTDRVVFLPVSLIGGLPVGYATEWSLIPLPPQAVDGLATWLQATVNPEPSSRLFAAPVIDPLEQVGYRIRRLEGIREAHGICDPDLKLVGLVMPMARGFVVDPPPARVAV